MMKKKVKITAAVSAVIISLLIILLHNQPPQEPPDPDISPVSVHIELDRGNTPPTENEAVVADESPETGTQNPTQDCAPVETDFEPSTTADSKEILTESSPSMDNPTPTPAPPNNTTATKVCEPKMGDTRIVNGQKQSYFLGFGWVDDMGENEVIYCEGM